MNGIMSNIWMFVLIFVVAVLVGVVIRAKVKTTAYDERQQLARGIAFRNGFFATMFFLCVNLMLEMAEIAPWENVLGCVLAIYIGVGTSVVTAICKDAYVAYEGDRKRLFIIYGIIVACLTGSMVLRLVEDGVGMLYEEGKLTMGVMPVLTDGLFLSILVTAMVHQFRNREEE